jgi:hypothetical protein
MMGKIAGTTLIAGKKTWFLADFSKKTNPLR